MKDFENTEEWKGIERKDISAMFEESGVDDCQRVRYGSLRSTMTKTVHLRTSSNPYSL